MQLFYGTEINGDMITLSEQESAHCIRVMRMKTGDKMDLTDGKGHFFKGEILIAHDKKTEVRIEETIYTPPVDNRLHLYVALTKQADRLEWMLEKCVELGLASFTPLITHRTERKNIRVDRLELIALSAMKQSLKAWSTTVHPAQKFKDAVKINSGVGYIAHCIEDTLKTELNQVGIEKNTHIFIGPEGDFTPDEVALALQSGLKPVSLGPSRLRTETAGLAACNWMYWYNIKTQ